MIAREVFVKRWHRFNMQMMMGVAEIRKLIDCNFGYVKFVYITILDTQLNVCPSSGEGIQN